MSSASGKKRKGQVKKSGLLRLSEAERQYRVADILFCSHWCHTSHLVCSCRCEETINLPVPGQTRLNQCTEKSHGNPSMVFGGKESACQCRRSRFNRWVKKIPWRRKWQSTPVFLPGKSHGQRNVVGYCPWGCKRVGHDLPTKQQQAKHTPKQPTKASSSRAPSTGHPRVSEILHPKRAYIRLGWGVISEHLS